MKISVIGSSGITESFIRASRSVAGADVIYCCSRTESRAREFAEKYGLQPRWNYDELLRSGDIDTVYVASPNVCHYSQALEALRAGVNVICEKPLTVTPDQARSLFDVAEDNGAFLFEAMKSVYSLGRPIIERELSKLGEIRSAHLDFSQRSSRYDALMRGEIPNIFRPELCAGGLMDLGVYPIYVSVMLFGKPDKVLSHCDFIRTGADIAGSMIFVYPELTVTITYSKAAAGHTGSRILGSDGAIVIKSISKLTGITRYENDGSCTELLPPDSDDDAMAAEIERIEQYYQAPDAVFYNETKSFSMSAAEIMEEIRRQNGFLF
ncbi:MAG: Gfo/Idh/MocA family oxidoreductase [Clostridia bacterium]|nr:Gfo/Idh/MocA family oxidoreductase [Clostridia bacterium]